MKWRYWLGRYAMPVIEITGDNFDRMKFRTDCTIAMAFGRNTYPDDELAKVYSQYRHLHRLYDGNDYLMCQQLRADGFDPGQVNRDLARRCQELSYDWRVIIVQWEVAVALDPAWYEKHQGQIVAIWPSQECAVAGRFGTRDVMVAAIDYMHHHDLKRPRILAHRRHLLRACMVFVNSSGGGPRIGMGRWTVLIHSPLSRGPVMPGPGDGTR